MATGHAMTARWHLGPVTGHYFWWVLVTSPEVLVFLFFMITDPKTTPKSTRGRGALRRLDRAPRGAADRTREDGVLGEGRAARRARDRLRRAAAARAACPGSASTGACSSRSAPPRSSPTRARSRAPGSAPGPTTTVAPLADTGRLPQIAILPSRGVQTKLDRTTARPDRGRPRRRPPPPDDRARAPRTEQRSPARPTCDELPAADDGRSARAAGAPIEVARVPARPDARLARARPRPGRRRSRSPRWTGQQQLTVYTGVPARSSSAREAPATFRETLELQEDRGRWLVARVRSGRSTPVAPRYGERRAARPAAAKGFAGVRLTDVAAAGRARLPPGRLPLRRHRRTRRR